MSERLERLRRYLETAIVVVPMVACGSESKQPDPQAPPKRTESKPTERVEAPPPPPDTPRVVLAGGHHVGIPPGAKSPADLTRGTLSSHEIHVANCALATWCAPLGTPALTDRTGSGPGTDVRGCPAAIPTVPSPFGGPDIEARYGPVLPFQAAKTYGTSVNTPPRHLHPLVAEGDRTECCYRWAVDCRGGTSAEGRAYVDETAHRVAELHVAATVVAGRSVDALDAEHRHALAHHWIDVALAEHASIAAFALATIELMALGSPLELIDAMQRAARDEVRHARDAFQIASEYLGREIVPRQLPAIAPRATDLVRAAVDTYVEACVGETYGAARAAEAARGCTVAPVTVALTRVARDEARHAALAWSTLSWLLDRGGGEARRAVREVAANDPAPAREPAMLDAAILRRHGVLPFADAVALDRETRRTIIEPTLQRLGV